MSPLINNLILVAAAAGIAHLISRQSWRAGCTHGEETTRKANEKDLQLATLTGMARIRLSDARATDLVTELRDHMHDA